MVSLWSSVCPFIHLSSIRPYFCFQRITCKYQWIFTKAGTLQPLYNTVRYNTVLDITRFKDGSQRCIDYNEK